MSVTNKLTYSDWSKLSCSRMIKSNDESLKKKSWRIFKMIKRDIEMKITYKSLE